MAGSSWKKRVLTGGLVAPVIIFFLQTRLTTAFLGNLFALLLHNEYSDIICTILKFNSSESDSWYIDTMKSSLFIRFPTHYLLTAAAFSMNETNMHFHFMFALFLICGIRIYNFLKISEFLKQKKKTIETQVPVQFLDRKLYILSFFQICADILQFTLFVYPLTYPIISFQYKQAGAMNVIWALSVFQTDNGALFIGSMIGKHDFAPKISPKKTWEGVSGGIFLSVFTALILSQLNFLSLTELEPLHTKHFLILSLIISVISIYGDFVESFLKRVADIKDSGNIFPGHGGVLDRMDSLCFSAPFVYLYLKTFLPETLINNEMA